MVMARVACATNLSFNVVFLCRIQAILRMQKKARYKKRAFLLMLDSYYLAAL